MVHKIKKRNIAIAFLATLLLFPGICFLDSLRYPRIARSAYWRQPNLLAKATIACLFPGKGISKTTILSHAKQLTGKDYVNISLLYLPDTPKDDKTIRERVFGLVSKLMKDSSENLFWMVTTRNGFYDDTLAYEYKTGVLIVGQNMSQLGQVAQNTTTSP